jgi:ribonuclease D
MLLLLSDEADKLPALASPRAKFHLVENTEVLGEALRDLEQGIGSLAVDAERASGFKYSQRAYLIQLHRKGTDIYLIDPIALTPSDLEELGRFMNQQDWILHAATQDMPCLAELGLHPKSLFDTEMIARLLGFDRVGLGAVCEIALGLTLAKEHSAADWSTRPLPASWQNYAALDVDVLPEMKAFLTAEIEVQAKGEIVRQEMQHLLGFAPKPAKIDRWRSMSNFHELKDTRQVAIAKSLWEAREALAMKLDISPGRLVPDRSLIHAAKSQTKTKSMLAGDKAFNGRASRTYLDVWWSAFEAGLNARELPPMRLQATGTPNHRNWAAKYPEAEARLQAAKPVMAAISEENRIPVENLLTPDYLRQLCFEPEGFDSDSIAPQLRAMGAREWQVTLISARLAEAWSKIGDAPVTTA